MIFSRHAVSNGVISLTIHISVLVSVVKDPIIFTIAISHITITCQSVYYGAG